MVAPGRSRSITTRAGPSVGAADGPVEPEAREPVCVALSAETRPEVREREDSVTGFSVTGVSAEDGDGSGRAAGQAHERPGDRRQRAGEAAGLEAQRLVRLRDDRLRGVLRVGGVGVLVVAGERLDQLELAEGGEVRVEDELLLVAAVAHEAGQLARLLVAA